MDSNLQPQIHVRPESSARISSPGDASWVSVYWFVTRCDLSLNILAVIQANKRIESEENMHYTVFEERHESKVSAI